MTGFTLDQVQLLYFQTKQEQDVLSKKHAEEMAPYAKKLDLCKAWMLNFLQTTKQESARTEHGTCFQTTATSVTVDPDGGWDKLLDAIIRPAIARFANVMEEGGSDDQAADAARQGPELAFLNRAVNKTAVMELLEQHPETGPAALGVKVTQVVQLSVRKA